MKVIRDVKKVIKKKKKKKKVTEAEARKTVKVNNPEATRYTQEGK